LVYADLDLVPGPSGVDLSLEVLKIGTTMRSLISLKQLNHYHQKKTRMKSTKIPCQQIEMNLKSRTIIILFAHLSLAWTFRLLIMTNLTTLFNAFSYYNWMIKYMILYNFMKEKNKRAVPFLFDFMQSRFEMNDD
jgi:hypothetical protein